eukprot:COSAG01_NODE_5631_length_4130_cov_193.096750_4_plen_174_part_00
MPLDAEPPLLINLDTNSVTEWGAAEGQPLSDFTGPGRCRRRSLVHKPKGCCLGRVVHRAEPMGTGCSVAVAIVWCAAPELVPLLQTTAAHPLLRFSSSNPAELHAAVTEVFRAFFLALFGRCVLLSVGCGVLVSCACRCCRGCLQSSHWGLTPPSPCCHSSPTASGWRFNAYL